MRSHFEKNKLVTEELILLVITKTEMHGFKKKKGKKEKRKLCSLLISLETNGNETRWHTFNSWGAVRPAAAAGVIHCNHSLRLFIVAIVTLLERGSITRSFEPVCPLIFVFLSRGRLFLSLNTHKNLSYHKNNDFTPSCHISYVWVHPKLFLPIILST